MVHLAFNIVLYLLTYPSGCCGQKVSYVFYFSENSEALKIPLSNLLKYSVLNLVSIQFDKLAMKS